ncbi:MAG: hypothetical protein QXX08_11560, partial [Candidatus Bathyarchaeia archaeon]
MDNHKPGASLNLRDFETLIQKKRLVDTHALILFAEYASSLERLTNLREQWEKKAQDGLLPKVYETGIFDFISKLMDYKPKLREGWQTAFENEQYGFIQRLGAYFDKESLENEDKYQTSIRNFENIIDLTDTLERIHELLAITERSYWQRLEGYEVPAADTFPSATISEAGAIQRIYDAADFLCWDYRDKIKHHYGEHWRGLAVFGLFHEFRLVGNFICIPNYSKLQNLRMWIYTAHEVSHQAINDLSDDPEFESIKSDLIMIIKEHAPILSKYYASATHIVTELIADVFATLIAGEEYPITLAELKYYPTITVFEWKKLRARQIQVPVFLRILLCCWTAKISWGLKIDGVPLPLGDVL